MRRICQWIPDDPKRDATKCGRPARAGSPYCPECHARMYRPGEALPVAKLAKYARAADRDHAKRVVTAPHGFGHGANLGAMYVPETGRSVRKL